MDPNEFAGTDEGSHYTATRQGLGESCGCKERHLERQSRIKELEQKAEAHARATKLERDIRRDERKRVAQRLRQAAAEGLNSLASATITMVALSVEFMPDE